MSQPEPKLLESKPSRVGYEDGGAASVLGILFGTAFVALILFVVFTSHLKLLLPSAAPFVGGTVILFAVYNLFRQLHPCVLRYYAEQRMWALKTQFPTERWSFEYAWNLTGCYPSLGDPPPAWTVWVEYILLAFCLLPLNYYALFGPWPDRSHFKVIFLIDALGALIWLYGYWRDSQWELTRWFFLRYPSFPFYLGDEIVMELVPNHSLGGYRHLAFTLRCIEEHEVEVRRGKNTVWITQCFQIYAETYFSEGSGVLDRTPIPIRFVLPAEAFETSLWHEPPRYWELLVKADTNPPLAITFLLPVYKRNRADPQPDLIWEKAG